VTVNASASKLTAARLFWPAYLSVVVVYLTLPMLVVVLASFDSAEYVQFPPSGLTLKWYFRVFNSESIMLAIENSAIVGAGSTALAVILGVPASILIARGRFPGRSFLYAFILSPLTVPWIVFGLALLYFWNAVGLPITLGALIVGHTVIGLPYVVRTCTGVLVGIAPSYELAARTLGASRLRAFFLVTLPMMQMGIAAGAAFCLLLSFINVPVALFLTTSSTLTIQIAIFSYMLSSYDPTIAALSTIQLALILTALYAAQKIANIREFVI
jgi:putative spermidine/putrescine transport system permease protein